MGTGAELIVLSTPGCQGNSVCCDGVGTYQGKLCINLQKKKLRNKITKYGNVLLPLQRCYYFCTLQTVSAV